jgi:hypothetical protein
MAGGVSLGDTRLFSTFEAAAASKIVNQRMSMGVIIKMMIGSESQML